MPPKPIYLDYHATTPVDPRVLEAMLPYFTEHFGNPASQSHAYGWYAEEAVALARESIIKAIGGIRKIEIIFTSGATESNNLAVKGVVEASRLHPAHIITQKTEHASVMGTCAHLEKMGHRVTYLDVDTDGSVNPGDVRAAIRDNTVLCSVMYANNEFGTIQPIAEIASACHARGVLLHSDAAQAVGKLGVQVKNEGIDLLSFSAQKIYGPKGIGALYVSHQVPPIPLNPVIHGSGHERGLRSGTLNVPGIVGLAKALEICVKEMEAESQRLTRLRDYFLRTLSDDAGGIHVNGHPLRRLPGNINISIDGVRNDELILAAPEIAFSVGSACLSTKTTLPTALAALGLPQERVDSAIRIGLGRMTTDAEADAASGVLVRAIRRLRT